MENHEEHRWQGEADVPSHPTPDIPESSAVINTSRISSECGQSRPNLMDLPRELRLHIYRQLVVKQGSAIGTPDAGCEVSKEHFLREYCMHRNLSLALSCREANLVVSELFFSRNKFEFHHPSDFSRFLQSISARQRDQIFGIIVYWSVSSPCSREIDLETYKFRQFSDLSEADLECAFQHLTNGLVFSRSCNRLHSFRLKFRHRTHLQSLDRPVADDWVTAWREQFYKPPVSCLDAPFAHWDYHFTGVLEYLRLKAERCAYDIEEPTRNVLAREIDAFVDQTDLTVEMYDIKSDCDALEKAVQQARLETVKDDSGRITHQIVDLTCICCGRCFRKAEATTVPDHNLDLSSLAQFCWGCGSCDGRCTRNVDQLRIEQDTEETSTANEDW